MSNAKPGHVQPDWGHLSARLGPYQASVEAALAEIAAKCVLPRIWEHDHTLWKPEPTEITNRLGWLHIAGAMRENVQRLQALVQAVRQDGYTHVSLLGMGGSSLAPELFSKTFAGHGDAPSLDLAVLDSTDPGAVLAHAERLDLGRTLFIVATKSGGTVETLSFFKFFYNRVAEAVGADQVGTHFVAITDAGSKLDRLAARYGFRTIFLNDPHIGGRFSALSYFGLVAAALVGVDVPRLLERALEAARDCGPDVAVQDNPAARLGVILSELARAGRNKVTFAVSPAIASFGDWVEQLVAESTGKEGQGVLPVVGEPLGPPEVYGDDRLFVHLQLGPTALPPGDDAHPAAMQALQEAGHPVLRLHLRDRYDLGAQFFLWELATAVAGHRLGINPFEQPNVEAAKVLARQAVVAYKETGALPAQTPALDGDGITVYGDVTTAGTEKGKIVYVESDPERIDLVRLIFKRKGFEAHGVIGGKEGLETVRRVRPALVLVGRTLPDMDSHEVRRQIEADATLKHTTVIVMGERAPPIDEVLTSHAARPGSPGEALTAFLNQARPGDYVALQAFVQPSAETDAALLALRTRLRERYKLATTVGYGPRFLHSTGQLHKGDAGQGLFLQFTADAPRDAPIPDEAGAPDSSISFGTLIMAQALGDWQALLEAGRRVMRFHLGDDVVRGLGVLTK
jgi:glucose-6-phosphate isomerase/CheY-like chemotaxis protein